MTVKDVWGRADGLDVSLITRDGDRVWFFRIPDGVEGDFPAEFWAEDEAGNVGYSAAMLSLGSNGVKCIRMIRSDGVCVMRPIGRPSCVMSEPTVTCAMRPIVCACSEG